ncbi:MAG: histidinol dehydrogenase [Candidatus Peribacteraceae bacterium]|nr:histidinol dehydrogenase [Candidatus Peribacteraceae bacterium]MDD5742083.1 histidinol dehydrogenase [Candidatus Peribacteraceae bacterium]
MRILSLSSASKEEIVSALRRPTQALAAYREKVKPIIAAVRSGGDTAVRRFTKQFDGVDLPSIRVPSEELQGALNAIPKDLRKNLEMARENIVRFQQEAMPSSEPIQTQPGVFCWRETRPLGSAGLYVPGGSAPLVSTVLMLGIPAKLAGVGRIVLCTPPRKDGKVAASILAACAFVGIEEVFAVGGAQAVAAMAYGTESIPKIEKIAGPGNVYVSAAKAEVSVDPEGCAIDMLAGPSELMVIADGSANPTYIAADLLSQAEHDPFSQIILLTASPHLLADVQSELVDQLSLLPRKDIAAKALAGSCAILVPSLDEAIELANLYAPEHLSIQAEEPEKILEKIRNAGSVFLGSFSPEAVGDYCSGTNHVLPTSGTARVQGGVSIRTFQKTFTAQKLTKDGLAALRGTATNLARTEGLEAHARAVDLRFSSLP